MNIRNYNTVNIASFQESDINDIADENISIQTNDLKTQRSEPIKHNN